MPILHVIDHLGLGGCQTLLKGLFETNHNSDDIILFSLRKTYPEIIINHKNIFISTSKCKFSLKALFELKKLIKEKEINILHCHLLKSQLFGFLIKKIFFPKLKLIFHEHGQIFGSENKIKIDDFIYVRFLRIFKHHIDCFISISKASKNNLLNRCKIDEKKIIVLYNFISNRFIEKKEKYKIDKTKNSTEYFRIGFAGRLVERKGWNIFIEAANLLKHNNQLKFILAGDGPDKNDLLKKINEYQLSNVDYKGFISDIMNDFYNQIDVLVIPSIWEPMGLVELEAQATGIPVIASDVEALNEIIEDNKNGLLFKVNDANSLVEKINLLYSNSELRNKLIENGFDNVTNYKLDKYITELKKIYHNIENE